MEVGDRAVAVELHLVEPLTALRQLGGERRQHRLVALRPRSRSILLVMPADQQPVLLLPVESGGHERPGTLEPLAVQPDGQLAVALLLEQFVGAVVPDLDRPAAVLALRDLPREGRVVERVVLDVDGERALARLERDALRHSPRGERAVAFETEVVVKPACLVALDDEDRRPRAAVAAERLRRLRAVALAPVGVE